MDQDQRIWKILKKKYYKDYRTIRALKDTNDIITTDAPQIANILNNYFASVFCEEDFNNIPSCEYTSNIKCNDPSFDETLIKTKLNKLNTSKSIGVDKVHPRVLKECSESQSKPLSILFNCSWFAVLPLSFIACSY